jgi:acyl-coenzyme A synthetase/AMP-(fatty) acid ligase
MEPNAASGRARLLASLTRDLGRTLFRARDREWIAGEVLGAADQLRAVVAESQGPIGIAFAQPGWVLAALLAGWAERRLVLLIDPGLRREAEVVRRMYPGIRIYADRGPATDDRIDLGDALASCVPARVPPPWLTVPGDDEPFASLLTSASSGENKVVEKRGFQMYRQAEALASVLTLPEHGRILSFVPPYHLLGFFYGLVLPLVQGAETVLATEVTGVAMAELLEKYRPDLVVGTATHYRFLVRAAEHAPLRPPSTVYLSSGAPLDPAVAEAFAARFGTPVRDFYGSTEFGGIAFRAWPAPYRAMPSVRWRIDPETAALEVWSPWAGSAQDAWLATDDAAEPVSQVGLEDGFRLLGRLDHVVKVGGKRFSSVEVERALSALPGVAEAAAFPYARFGEPALAAAVAPEPGASLEEPTLRAFLAERLASYKLPRSILILPRLPRGSHDKIDYPALRALFAEAESAHVLSGNEVKPR